MVTVQMSHCILPRQILGTPVDLPEMTLAASEGEVEKLYLLKILLFVFLDCLWVLCVCGAFVSWVILGSLIDGSDC